MKLKDLFAVSHHQEIFIRGSEGRIDKPVFHYHLTSGSIPKEILEKEILSVGAAPVQRYGRDSAALTVHLKL